MASRKLTSSKRKAIARKARAARGPLSIEARERLRRAIAERRPWERSTGPRTDEGKVRASQNALKDGRRIAAMMPDDVRAVFRAMAEAEAGRGPIPDEAAVYVAGLRTMDAGERAGLWGLWARGAELTARHGRLVRRQAGCTPLALPPADEG